MPTCAAVGTTSLLTLSINQSEEVRRTRPRPRRVRERGVPSIQARRVEVKNYGNGAELQVQEERREGLYVGLPLLPSGLRFLALPFRKNGVVGVDDVLPHPLGVSGGKGGVDSLVLN